MNKKVLLAIVLLFNLTFIFAQEDKKEEPKEGWTKGGNVAITFNQSAFNKEWTGGGVSNMAANVLISYDFNLKKGDLIWDNKLIIDYGAFKNKGQDAFTKSNDRLEFNSLAGKKTKGFWYYSAYFNLKTQMDTGYQYANDGITRVVTISHSFSPAYFQAGPGLLWKKSDNLKINVSPAGTKYIIVHDEFAGSFGTDAGEISALELGASVQAYYKVNLMKNVSIENLLNLYSNYLDNPKDVDIDYIMNLVMKVNKYISTNLTFQAIADRNIYPDRDLFDGVQIRETFGVGVNLKF